MTPANDADGEAVPLFGTWRRAYAAVVLALAVDVALLYAVTRLLS